jgi:hypothetical protein
MFARFKPRSRILLLAFVFLYIIGFVVLSIAGKREDLTVEGGSEYGVWRAKWCWVMGKLPNGKQDYSLSPVGSFYLPLVLIDINFVHKTRLSYSMQGDGYRIHYDSP